MSRYRHVRCDHWLPPGWCPVEGCAHWDGRTDDDPITWCPSIREQAAIKERREQRAATVDPDAWCLPDPDWL